MRRLLADRLTLITLVVVILTSALFAWTRVH